MNYKKELLLKTKKITLSIHDWKVEGNMIMGVCNERTIEITKMTEIKSIAGFISIFNASIVKGLGIQGEILWYDADNRLLVSMSFDVVCDKFQFEYKGRLYQKRISRAGKHYFEGLVRSFSL
ncbi:hypothetical protein TREAZ_0783 [Leadbettera azotonutricia ZAS-9]|uniref:Uncharacterized protein n=2 Tax=Leadbettera azotonutricia TaxID=150829 RepID=F5Y9P5_LEAAZ|nr:hypothetical protein TREAZ_0783 [Leadbettera azotonutricia ZAS-9]